MYIIPIAWLYVALMMAVAEGTNHNGTVLGAVITFVLYGLVPVLLVLYLMGAPSRRKAIKAKEDADWKAAQNSNDLQADKDVVLPEPDAGGHTATAPQINVVAPVRKEP